MTQNIRESDWKILKQLHEVALERFCQRVLSEIGEISSDISKTSHQRYLDLYKTVHLRDKEISNAFNNLRRSSAFMQIAHLQSRGFLENEEFLRFSDETRALIEAMLE